MANTADTRAVLSRQGAAIDLTIDRKASDPEEVARIAESGGFVANGRVQVRRLACLDIMPSFAL